MQRFVILGAITLTCFLASGQSKLLVTDFIFFNNFDSPNETYIPNFFRNDPDRLQEIRSLTSLVLGEKYDSLEVYFHEKSTWFAGYQNSSEVDSSEWYRDNHKKLLKEGGHNYYLRLYAEISEVRLANSISEYVFTLQVRISDSRGKKVFRNIFKAPFSSSFSPSVVNDGALLARDEFFEFFESGIPLTFKGKKSSVSTKKLQRPHNKNFDEFVRRAKSFALESTGSKTHVLKHRDSVLTQLKISHSTLTESEQPAVLAGHLEMQQTMRINNPMLDHEWNVRMSAPSKKAQELPEVIEEKISIRVRTEKQVFDSFEFKNGRLTGKIGSKTYLLIYESVGRLMLVYVDQELSALLQPNGKVNSTLKLLLVGEETLLPVILNLHQIHKQTTAVFM